MSNFEKNLDKHLRELDGKIAELYRERNSLDWGHDCDCEFCDEQQVPPEETEVRADEIRLEVKDIERFKKILTAHVERYKVKK